MANFKRYGDIVLTFGSSSSSSSTAGTCYGVWSFGADGLNYGDFYCQDFVGTSDDGILLAGMVYEIGNGYDIYLALMKIVGNEVIWFKRYANTNDINGGYGQSFCVIEVSDGYVVLGKEYDLTPYEEYPDTGTIMNRLIKVNKTTGDIIWATQEHTIFADSAGHSLRQAADGGFIWSSTQFDGNYEYGFGQYTELMMKTDSTGVIEWQVAFSYDITGKNGFCVQTADGGYAHLFSGEESGGTVNVILTKLDSSGNKTWGKIYTIADGSSGWCSGFQYTSDGGYVALLGSYDNGVNDDDAVIILKLTSDGSIQWSKQITQSDAKDYYYDGVCYNIVEVSDGYIFCLADRSGLEGTDKSKIVKIDDSGNLVWCKEFSGTVDENTNLITEPRIQILPDGSLGVIFLTDTPIDMHNRIFEGFVKISSNGAVPMCPIVVDSTVNIQTIEIISETSTIPANTVTIPMVTPVMTAYDMDPIVYTNCDCETPRVLEIAQSYSATFAKLSNGDIYSAGPNYNGACGTGPSAIDFPNSSIVLGLVEYEKVNTFQDHTFFIDTTGVAWFTGQSAYGEDGVRYDWVPAYENNPPFFNISTPQLGPTQGYDLDTTLWTYDLRWNKIAIGGWSVNGIDSTGKLWGWGYNAYGMLGINIPEPGTAMYPFPVACITSVTDWVHVDVGQALACGIDGGMKLYVWGAQGYGEDYSDLAVPTQIGLDGYWLDCQTGEYSFVALNDSGALYAAGDLSYYMAGSVSDSGGDLDIPQLSDMVDVSDGKYITQVALGWYHIMILDEEGKLWTRGANFAGELGIGSSDYNLEEPVWQAVRPDLTFTKIRADYSVSMALDVYNRLWVWGEIPTTGDDSYWVTSPILWEPGGFTF